MNNKEAKQQESTAQCTIQNVRRSVMVEFMLNDHKVFDKCYWDGDKEMIEDIKQWRSESPLKNVRYVD
jgi:hypothetical protein